MSDPLNLKNTIVLPDPSDATQTKEFNINAVYSDEAGKVTKPLVIKESGNEVGKFYGSINTSETTKSEIDYVPSTGGTFSGAVHRVYSDNSAVNPDDNEFVTSAQVDNKVIKLAGAPICKWDPENSDTLSAFKIDDEQFSKLTSVIGTSDDFELLNSLLRSTASDGLIFDKNNDGTYAVTGIEGGYTDKNLLIPNTYKGPDDDDALAVTSVYAEAFSNNNNLTSVIIADGITSIIEKAFYNCSNLKKIVIPSSVTSIGDMVFANCTGLTGVNIPDSVTSIGAYAFESCSNLKSVVIGNGVKNISNYVFEGCASLQTIVIPASVTSIGDNAFNNCSNLTTVYYGGSESDWETLIKSSIGANNEILKNISELVTNATKGPDGTIKIEDLVKSPVLYYCKDSTDTSTDFSNKVFLKLPSEEAIQISNGATRLDSISDAEKYYTYESLAAIVAKINTRLNALGLKTVTIPEVNLDPVTVLPESLKTEVTADKAAEESVATIQQLQNQITALTGKDCGCNDSNNVNIPGTNVAYTDTVKNAVNAKNDSDGNEIKTNYYRSASNAYTNNNANINTIEIVNTIPTNTAGYSNGDICIVIK